MSDNFADRVEPLFPVYQAEAGVELPKHGTYYVLTKDGVYLHKDTVAASALVKVQGVPWLESVETDIQLKLPKIPARIIGQAHCFFRKVWNKLKSESYLTLFYSQKTNSYQLWCPKQQVTSGSVHYERDDQPDFNERRADGWPWVPVGTIHSHCNFSAFHSGTDTHDESTFDGIHITLGHVDRDQFSMVSSVAINNVRQQMDPENCCEGVSRHASKKVKFSKWMSFDDSSFFDLVLSEDDAQGLVRDEELIEKEWMPKVEYGWKGGNRNSGSFFHQGSHQNKSGKRMNHGGAKSSVAGDFDDDAYEYYDAALGHANTDQRGLMELSEDLFAQKEPEVEEWRGDCD
jgi:hypothetical protein